MNTLLLDIETAPNTAFVWGLFDQNVSHEQVKETSYVMCWSAKWLGNLTMHFAFVRTQQCQRKPMLRKIHALLDAADIVVTYNGNKFDIPVLNREFIKHGLLPPSPYKQVDIYKVVRHVFRFDSNKMDSVLHDLDMGRKLKHKGFALWTECMDGDSLAWKKMTRYNMRDVKVLEKLYHRVRPWIRQHPQMTEEGLCCTKCGSSWAQRRGVQLAVTRVYQRYCCRRCGGWFRSNKALDSDNGERGINI